MNVPDYIPVLSRGNHTTPKDGACVMEMVAFLAGEEHSDNPECVDPLLRSFAIKVNDYVSNDNRNKISALIHRFMGTSGYYDFSGGNNPWDYAYDKALEDFYTLKSDFNCFLNENKRELFGAESERVDNEAIKILVKLIDRFDEIYGRTQAVQIDMNLTKAHPSQVTVDA